MSKIEVNEIVPQSGTTLTLGGSGDTLSIASGVSSSFPSLTVSGDLTVDTNTLYVDSANNRVGIGTASPATALEISNNNPRIRLTDANYLTGSQVEIQGDNGNIFINADQTGLNSNRLIAFQLNNSEAMRITSAGNVGIGTSSPDSPLHVVSTSLPPAHFQRNTSGTLSVLLSPTGTNTQWSVGAHSDGYFRITNEGIAERIRIDSSGNFYLGTTDNTLYSATSGGGIFAVPNGSTTIARQSNTATQPIFILNETGVDGTFAEFRKDGTIVGSIGVKSTDNFYIADSNDAGITFIGTGVSPVDSDGAGNPNALDLGDSFNTWKDLYLAGNIYLGGTGSANALDDYEEGTWTPRFISSGGEYTITYAGQQGRYTKIGQTVICHFLCAASGTAPSGGSGTFRLGNLPFLPTTQSVVPAGHGSVGISNNLNINIDAVQLVWNVGTDATYADLMFLTDNSSITSTSNSPYTIIHNANSRLDGTLVYRTNA